MQKTVNNRPVKYNKRNKEVNKAYYPVSSLVTKVTGLNEGDIRYPAALKEIQRIIKNMQNIVDNKGTLKIAPESIGGMIFLTKAFMPEGAARAIYEKIRANKELTEAEEIELTSLFKEAVELNEDGPEKQFQLDNAQAAEEFMALMDDIRAIISQDVDLADNIMMHTNKVATLRNYRDFLISSLEEWRNETKDYIANEQHLIRLTEFLLEKGYQASDVRNILSDDLAQAFANELMKQELLEETRKRIK